MRAQRESEAFRLSSVSIRGCPVYDEEYTRTAALMQSSGNCARISEIQPSPWAAFSAGGHPRPRCEATRQCLPESVSPSSAGVPGNGITSVRQTQIDNDVRVSQRRASSSRARAV